MADNLRVSLCGIELKDARDTDRELGRGAYAVVNEFVYKGIRYERRFACSCFTCASTLAG